MQKIIYNFAIDNHIENLHSIISAMVVVFVMSFGTACIVNEKEVKETQAWAGIGYIAAKKVLVQRLALQLVLLVLGKVHYNVLHGVLLSAVQWELGLV